MTTQADAAPPEGIEHEDAETMTGEILPPFYIAALRCLPGYSNAKG